MANRLKGEIAFTAFDESYTLLLDINALCAIEADFGIKANEIGEFLSGSMTNVRAIFRIALGAKHGDLTDIEVGRIMNEIGLGKAAAMIADAVKAAFPEFVGNGPAPQAKAARSGTGRRR